jgi:hypothetical protein
MVMANECGPVSQAARRIDPMLAAVEAAGLENLEHRMYPEARHDLFNEVNRDEVTGHLIAWRSALPGVCSRSVANYSVASSGVICANSGERFCRNVPSKPIDHS